MAFVYFGSCFLESKSFPLNLFASFVSSLCCCVRFSLLVSCGGLRACDLGHETLRASFSARSCSNVHESLQFEGFLKDRFCVPLLHSFVSFSLSSSESNLLRTSLLTLHIFPLRIAVHHLNFWFVSIVVLYDASDRSLGPVWTSIGETALREHLCFLPNLSIGNLCVSIYAHFSIFDRRGGSLTQHDLVDFLEIAHLRRFKLVALRVWNPVHRNVASRLHVSAVRLAEGEVGVGQAASCRFCLSNVVLHKQTVFLVSEENLLPLRHKHRASVWFIHSYLSLNVFSLLHLAFH